MSATPDDARARREAVLARNKVAAMIRRAEDAARDERLDHTFAQMARAFEAAEAAYQQLVESDPAAAVAFVAKFKHEMRKVLARGEAEAAIERAKRASLPRPAGPTP